jgi:hypothetical protein
MTAWVAADGKKNAAARLEMTAWTSAVRKENAASQERNDIASSFQQVKRGDAR